VRASSDVWIADELSEGEILSEDELSLVASLILKNFTHLISQAVVIVKNSENFIIKCIDL